jgi:hypothetical protein
MMGEQSPNSRTAVIKLGLYTNLELNHQSEQAKKKKSNEISPKTTLFKI